MLVRSTLVVALLAGCAATPPERVERDRIIMAAVQPCKERYSERLYNTNMMSVNADGTVRYFYKGDQVGAVEDISGCLAAATKGLRFGPWLAGRLARPGPASVPITTAGKDVLVPIRINGILGTMVVRAGAEFTFITSSYASRAGVQVVSESPTIRIRSAGQSMVTPYARARAIEIGDAQVEGADVVVYPQVHDHPTADGVLGKPFLSHFKMTVDREAGRLTLEPIGRKS